MRVAVHQPNYAPWAGYFAKLAAADVLVFLDDAQLPQGRSYVSRTAIAGPGGPAGDAPQWLSVPIARAHDAPIRAARFADAGWARRHMATLRARYARAPYFAEVMALLAPLYDAPGALLAPFNARLVQAVAAYLSLAPRFLWASELGIAPGLRATERLVALVQAAGGTTYVSGAGGASYQDPACFAAAGITLEVRRYTPQPYDQGTGMHGRPRPFVPGLSVLDLLFRRGRAAAALLNYVQ